MIINLTQHPATAEQITAGVLDLPPARRASICQLLTFDALPTYDEIEETANSIALIADSFLPEEGPHQAMIGGAPWLMAPLEIALRNQIITPIYAFSKRVSEEQLQPDGTVLKVARFKHEGFVEV